MKKICCLSLIAIFTACSSIRYMDIETFNPSEITFPPEVKKILVVNNAVPQPAETGYEIWIMGAVQDTARAHADSALYDACRVLGETIVDANYFDDVLLYHHPIRTDQSFLSDPKLTQEQVRSLCDETGTDAIISFDRLVFNMEKNIIALIDGYYSGQIKVQVGGTVRAYMPKRDNALATILVSDSIAWQEYAEDVRLLNYFLPTADDALRGAGKYIGGEVYRNFVPFWQSETRWFYTGFGTRWKEASAYAAGSKWEQATSRWNTIYESSSGKSKAKAASNLALSAEMQGKFNEAHTWAERSRDLFLKHGGEESRDAKLLTIYAEALSNRINADRKLDMQFSPE